MRFFTVISVMAILISGLFAQNGKISGVVFSDFTYSEDEDITNSFEIQRAYFTYKQKLSKSTALKFQTDVGRQKGEDDDPRLFAYLKNAKLDWKTELGKITFGLQGMNMFAVQEKNWGYRFIEKSAMDKNKFSSSADLGIGYANSYHKNLNYSVLVTNGTGYKKSENDSYKKISGLVVFGEKRIDKNKGFNTGAVFSYEPFKTDSGQVENIAVSGLFAAFSNKTLRLGAEFNLLNNSFTNTQKIVSAYINYNYHSSYNLFSRVDYLDKDGKTEQYLITGFMANPAKGLNIAPNIRYHKNDKEDDLIYKLNFEFKF